MYCRLSIFFSSIFMVLSAFALVAPQVAADDRQMAQNESGKLTLYFYRAPNPLNWDTPGQLTRTTFHNSLFGRIGNNLPEMGADEIEWEDIFSMTSDTYDEDPEFGGGNSHPHPISHINVAVKCPGEESFYGGATSIKSQGEYLREMLFKGASMETLILNVPGRLYTRQEIQALLPELKKAGEVHQLSYLINQQDCRRLLNYTEEYKEYRFDEIYGGLDSHPLEGDGAGCAAFGMSFLKVLNLYDKDLDDLWMRSLRIPKKYMRTADTSAEKGFWSFVVRRYNGAWAQPHEPHKHINFWDPDLMFYWIEDVHHGDASVPGEFSYRLDREERSLIIEVDAREKPPQRGGFWRF